MSPLRFFGSLVVGRLTSRRICAQAVRSARLLHQSRNPADGGGGDLASLTARKLIDEEALEEQATDEEKAMKKRFEEWMIKYGRTYEDKEDKALHYEAFKRHAQFVDKHNAKGSGCTLDTNQFADETEEESRLAASYGSFPMTEEEVIRHSVNAKD